MIVRYGMVGTIRLEHEYEGEGHLCRDCNLAALSSTKLALAERRIMTRAEPGVLRLFAAMTADGQPLAELSGALELSFGLRMSSPDFANYTAFPDRPPRTWFYAGSQAATDGAPHVHRTTGPVQIRFEGLDAPAVFRVRNAFGRTLEERSVEAENDVVEFNYDLRRHTPGVFSVFVTHDDDDESLRYITAELHEHTFFGVAHVVLPEGLNPDEPFERAVEFEARGDRWTYNVELSAAPDEAPRIVDPGGEHVFDPPEELASGRLRIRSSREIAFTRQPVELQLFTRSGPQATPRVAKLPNPSSMWPKAEVFLYL